MPEKKHLHSRWLLLFRKIRERWWKRSLKWQKRRRTLHKRHLLSSRAREKKAPTNTRRESNLSKGRLIRRAETLEAQVIRRQRPISRHGMTLAYIWGRVSLRD